MHFFIVPALTEYIVALFTYSRNEHMLRALNECHCWAVSRTCSSSSVPHGFGPSTVQLGLAWTNTCGLVWAELNMIETGLQKEPSCVSENPLWHTEYFPRVHQTACTSQAKWFICQRPLTTPIVFKSFFFPQTVSTTIPILNTQLMHLIQEWKVSPTIQLI